MNKSRIRIPVVPASFFGIVLGLVGLGNAWRSAHDAWGLPAVIGESLMLSGGIAWMILVVLFVGKWLIARDDALREAQHPVQCCFISLVGVATMLIAIALHPYSRAFANAFFLIGVVFTLGFALWRTGTLWQGSRNPSESTPVLFLPTVAGSYVTAIACATLGLTAWGQLAFGIGIFSWLAIESVLLHRLYTFAEMSAPLRPTLGIQLAPPAVGAAAYLTVTSGPPDIVAYSLIGYGLMQLLLLTRLARWIFSGGILVSAWSFTFGLTALATAMVKLVSRGDTGPISVMAPVLLALVSLVLVALVFRTAWLLLAGRILPPRAVAAPIAPSGAA